MRKCPHFHFNTNDDRSLRATDRFGKVSDPTDATGATAQQVLEGLLESEADGSEFLVWCEAKITNGDHVRCWPEYRKNEGAWYDWVMIHFETDDVNDDAKLYPAKVLALYRTRNDATLKALVHSVDYKLPTCPEGPFGDSKLMTHYRKEFVANGKPGMRSVAVTDIRHTALVYEAIADPTMPVPPIVRSATLQKRHTVMVVRPRDEWATLFIRWAREMKERRINENDDGKYRL